MSVATAEALAAPLVERHAQVLAGYLARQAPPARRALDAGRVLAMARWDRDLARLLLGMATLTAATVGADAAAELDGEWDDVWGQEYLTAVAGNAAVALNAATARRLADALAAGDDEDRDDLFARALGPVARAWRSDRFARTQTTAVGQFARHEAGAKLGAAEKRWVVRSPNPRSAHQRLGGEIVAIDDRFSNGARHPGDPALPADQRANCQCVLQLIRPTERR